MLRRSQQPSHGGKCSHKLPVWVGNYLKRCFKFSDSFMAATSLLLAVAVRATTGTDRNVAHNIPHNKMRNKNLFGWEISIRVLFLFSLVFYDYNKNLKQVCTFSNQNQIYNKKINK